MRRRAGDDFPSRLRRVLCATAVWLLFFAGRGPCGAEPLTTWAVVGETAIQQSGLSDLITVAMSEMEGISLVERERLDSVRKEWELAAFFGDSGVTERLAFGEVSGADALLLLRPGPETNGAKVVQAVVVDCRAGARLAHFRVSGKSYADPQVLAKIVEQVQGVRRRFPRGVEVLVALPDFASVTFSTRWDHLRSVFRELLQSGLERHPGVATVEMEEARALAKERSVAGGQGTVSAPLVAVEVLYQVISTPERAKAADAADDRNAVSPSNPMVHIRMKLRRSGQKPIAFPPSELTLANLLRRLSDRVPRTILAAARYAADETVEDGWSVERQVELLRENARRIETTGDLFRALELRAAAVLLEDPPLRGRLSALAELEALSARRLYAEPLEPKPYCQRHPDAGEEFAKWKKAAPEEYQRSLRARLRWWQSYMYHTEAVIGRGEVGSSEAARLIDRAYGLFKRLVYAYQPDEETLRAIWREFVWSTVPQLPRLDPQRAIREYRSPEWELFSGGYSYNEYMSKNCHDLNAAQAFLWARQCGEHVAAGHVDPYYCGYGKIDPKDPPSLEEIGALLESLFRYWTDVVPPDFPPFLKGSATTCLHDSLYKLYLDGLVTETQLDAYCARLGSSNSRIAKFAGKHVPVWAAESMRRLGDSAPRRLYTFPPRAFVEEMIENMEDLKRVTHGGWTGVTNTYWRGAKEDLPRWLAYHDEQEGIERAMADTRPGPSGADNSPAAGPAKGATPETASAQQQESLDEMRQRRSWIVTSYTTGGKSPVQTASTFLLCPFDKDPLPVYEGSFPEIFDSDKFVGDILDIYYLTPTVRVCRTTKGSFFMPRPGLLRTYLEDDPSKERYGFSEIHHEPATGCFWAPEEKGGIAVLSENHRLLARFTREELMPDETSLPAGTYVSDFRLRRFTPHLWSASWWSSKDRANRKGRYLFLFVKEEAKRFITLYEFVGNYITFVSEGKAMLADVECELRKRDDDGGYVVKVVRERRSKEAEAQPLAPMWIDGETLEASLGEYAKTSPTGLDAEDDSPAERKEEIAAAVRKVSWKYYDPGGLGHAVFPLSETSALVNGRTSLDLWTAEKPDGKWQKKRDVIPLPPGPGLGMADRVKVQYLPLEDGKILIYTCRRLNMLDPESLEYRTLNGGKPLPFEKCSFYLDKERGFIGSTGAKLFYLPVEGDAPDPALLEKTLHAYVPAERRIAHHRAVAVLVAAGAKVYRAHPGRAFSNYDTEDYYTLLTIDDESRMTAAAWDALSELWDCRHIQVYNVSLNEKAREGLLRVSSLRHLDLREVEGAGELVPQLGQLERLERLDLLSESYDDSTLDAVPSAPTLKSLGLYGPGLTYEGLDRLKRRIPTLEKAHWYLTSEQFVTVKKLREAGSRPSP